MKEYPARKLSRQAERFSIDELRDATVRLARLDHALKGGSKLAPELELQLAVADVTPRAALACRRARSRRARRAADDARGLRLLARRGVPVERAAGGGPVDRAHELAVLGGDRASSPSATAVSSRFASVLIVER